jgi:hypothetical protein
MGSINGTPAGDSLGGGDGADTFLLQDGGDDSVGGGAGNDGFYFGAALTGAESVDGGDGIDSVALQGDYTAGLTLGDIRNVETLVFLSGADTRFGQSGEDRYSYMVKTVDENVAGNGVLSVIATGLQAGEDLNFNGSNEQYGGFRLYAGIGDDTLRGGNGNDGFFFGADGNFTAADRIDGGAGTDTLALRGNYGSPGQSLVIDSPGFNAGAVANVEVLALLSGHSREYTGSIVPDGFDYDITYTGFVTLGQVNATGLQGDETLRFDASGSPAGYQILSGAGDDVLIGAQGGDLISGGFGQDLMVGNGDGNTFIFRFFNESTAARPDTIVDRGRFDMISMPTLDANIVAPGRQTFVFIADYEFGGIAGELRAVRSDDGNWLLQGDVDGDRVADMVIKVHAVEGASWSYDAGGYLTQVLPPPPPPPPPTPPLAGIISEQEANDSIWAAQWVDPGRLGVSPNPDFFDPSLPTVTIRGAIASATDVDGYVVSLKAGEELILDIDHSRGGLDPVLSLYGPNRVLIGDNDDSILPDAGSDEGVAVDGHNTDSMIVYRAPTTGEYRFTVVSFDHASSGSYDLQVSVGPPVSRTAMDAENIEALISGAQWPDPAAITYSFPTSAADYADYAGYDDPDLDQPGSFVHFSLAQQAAARSAFVALSGFTDLAFSEVTANRGSAMLRYAMSNAPDTAYAVLPGELSISGDAW